MSLLASIMHGMLLLAMIGFTQLLSARAQASFHLCSNFAQQRHRNAIIFIDDAEGDGTLRLCHCHVYSSDYRPYAITALALETSEKGVTLRTLDRQKRNNTRHLIVGDSFYSADILSLGVSYLKSSRRATTFVLTMLPLSPGAELLVQCTASGKGFLPDGVDGINAKGETTMTGSGDPSNSAERGGNSGSGESISVTTVALSVVILALVAVIATVAYQYYKIRCRYKRVYVKEQPSIREKGDGGNKGIDGPAAYQTEPSYEPIPEAVFSGQIQKYPGPHAPRPVSHQPQLPPTEVAPVAPRRTTSTAPSYTGGGTAPSAYTGGTPEQAPPRPSKRSTLQVVPTAPVTYDTIDQNSVGEHNTYDSLDHPH